MKKPNQVPIGEAKTGQKSSQPKANAIRRTDVPMTRALRSAIRAKANQEGVTKSMLAVRALRKHLSKPIPKTWRQVASIDFSGCLDRDCEHRIIYKTPAGELKSLTKLDGALPRIDDVTRKQVKHWLLNCVLPEEFEPDFQRVDRPSRELLISSHRSEQLYKLAEKWECDARAILRGAVKGYLAFVERFRHLAQARPQFVQCDAACPALLDELDEHLDDTCDVYLLDRNSTVDSALRVYFQSIERDSAGMEWAREHPGDIDPENIAFLLSQASSPAQCMFAKIANQLQDQPFEAACGDLGAFRELMKYHPGMKDEREALEMITAGADRLWASPAQAFWRNARRKREELKR